MITITENKGFELTFDNGLTVSCQIGNTNKCNNFNLNKMPGCEMSQDITKCSNCEVTILNRSNRPITDKIFEEMGLGSVIGDAAVYVHTMTVAKIISYVSTRDI